ncbi:uncharacterized protein LOC124371228 [Homalodisca vitripennis]|uniref:uncharacterized protein LOC124371228 n=1 Tax=Homalodisca vitripennis TaxID=197043 RepID=UPI001EEB5111|nr:uncharacterized protein LOC124371228 [Homalodisca vitripennis]
MNTSTLLILALGCVVAAEQCSLLLLTMNTSTLLILALGCVVAAEQCSLLLLTMNTSTLLILALGCVVAAEQSEFSQEEYKRVIVECKKEVGFSEKDLDMTEMGKVGMERFDPRDQYKRMVSCAMKALKLMDESGEMDTKRSSDLVDSMMKGRAPEEALQAKTVLMECAEKRLGDPGRYSSHATNGVRESMTA